MVFLQSHLDVFDVLELLETPDVMKCFIFCSDVGILFF